MKPFTGEVVKVCLGPKSIKRGRRARPGRRPVLIYYTSLPRARGARRASDPTHHTRAKWMSDILDFSGSFWLCLVVYVKLRSTYNDGFFQCFGHTRACDHCWPWIPKFVCVYNLNPSKLLLVWPISRTIPPFYSGSFLS